MRYDTKVDFITTDSNQPLKYNPKTGRMEDAPKKIISKNCFVYDGGAPIAVQLYGRTEAGSVVIAHLGKVVKAREVNIGADHYKVEQSRQLRNKASYLLGEVKNGT